MLSVTARQTPRVGVGYGHVDSSYNRARGVDNLSEFAEIQRQVIEQAYPTDKTIVEQKWGQAFVLGLHSFQIYEAIASTGEGESDTSGFDKMPYTKIPPDFWLDKPDPSDEEVALRMRVRGWQIFNKAPGVPQDAPAPDGFNPKENLINMRDSVIGYVKPRLERLAIVQLNAYDPDYRFSGGRKVNSMDDFEEAIVHAPWDNAQRSRVDFVQNGMWGSSNQLCLALSNSVMDLFKISYTPYLCCGRKPAKSHQGGSIKKGIVRVKGSSIVNRIRSKTKSAHKEILYRRNQKLVDTKNVVKMIPATTETYGFNGTIGICHGHAMLFQDVLRTSMENAKNMISPSTPAKTPDPESARKGQLRKWFEDKRRAGREITPEDHMLIQCLGWKFDSVTDNNEAISFGPQPVAREITTTDRNVTPETTARKALALGASAEDDGLSSDEEIAARTTEKRTSPLDPTRPNKKRKEENQNNLDKESIENHNLDKESIENHTSSDSDDEDSCDDAQVCNHKEYESFMPWDNSYYKPAFISKKKNVPRKCVGACGLTFSTCVSADVNKFVKITKNQPVNLCKNAGNENHSCLFALCNGCFCMHILKVESEKEAENGKKRRAGRTHTKRVVVQPGERIEDGRIVGN